MKLGFFTNAFKNFSLEYTAEALRVLGYHGMEIWCKGQHVTPFDGPGKVEYVRHLARDKNLKLCALSAHLDFITADDELRNRNIEKLKRVMDIASELRVEKVITASGYLNEVPQEDRRGMRDRFLLAMEELGKYARRKGIFIALEPEPEKFLRTPRQAVEFIEELDIPVFKTVCDLSHAIALNMKPEDFVAEMEAYLGHVHLDDAVYGQHPHRHLIPGDGEIDYDGFFKFLDGMNYDGWVSMELNQHTERPKEAAAKAIEFLKSRGFV